MFEMHTAALGTHTVHYVSKNDTALACYSFDVHRPILIFLAEMLLRK